MNKAVKFTLITVSINLIIALLIFIWVLSLYGSPWRDLFNFIKDFAFNLSIGIAFLAIASFYIGKKMQKMICVRKWNSILTGMCGLLLILIFGTFGGSTVGFIDYGMESNDTISELIVDYYYKPFFWILFYGILPTLISGGILGRMVAKKTCYNN